MNIVTDIKNIKTTEIEITGEIPADVFTAYKAEIVNKYRENTTIDGFRKGKAPEKVVIEKIGEDKILLDMAEKAIQEYYPKIIKEKKLNVIGRPDVQITKIAKDNPLGFKIITAVLPDIKLPDYKKIAKEINNQDQEKITIVDKEIDEVIENIRQNKAKSDPVGSPEPEKEGEKIKLPELDDEFAKSVGKFSSLDDLKKKVKENLTQEKNQKAKEKIRVAIIEKIGETIDIEIPKILIQNELNKMFLELGGQVEQMGLKFDDYLIHLKKTEDELKKGWLPDAEKRVKFGLVMHKISEDAKITPTPEEIKKETEAIMNYYEKSPEKLDEDRVRAHTENMLTNEKVFELLEQA